MGQGKALFDLRKKGGENYPGKKIEVENSCQEEKSRQGRVTVRRHI